MEALSMNRMAAEQAIARFDSLVPGAEVPYFTLEEVKDGYLDLKSDYEMVVTERDGLLQRVADLTEALAEAQAMAAAANHDASPRIAVLEAENARLHQANTVLRARLSAA